MQTFGKLSAWLVFASSALAAPQSHPHFDDGGTLHWSSSFEQAKQAAKAADKLIFVEYGREA